LMLVLRDGVQQLFGPTAEVLQKLMPAAAAPAVAAAPGSPLLAAGEGA